MDHQQSTDTTNDDDSVASDRLRGAREIGREIGEPAHRVYKLWSTHRLPASGRMAGTSRARRRRFAALTTIAHAPESENTNAAPSRGRRSHFHLGISSVGTLLMHQQPRSRKGEWA
jgi:hypothetical protein